MSFDRLAPAYRWMELILAGDRLQRCRLALLDRCPTPSKILILGEGPGRTLEECRARYPAADILCVDLSAAMLAQARKYAGAGRTRFLQADATIWRPGQCEFDLIITHFFLDVFRPEQLETLIPAFARSLAPGGSWLIADFQEAASGWKKRRSQAILWLMYRFFRIVTNLPADRLAPPDPHLAAAGLSLAGRVESEWGLLKSDRWIRPHSGARGAETGEIFLASAPPKGVS